jgi:predicted acetyltransferase
VGLKKIIKMKYKKKVAYLQQKQAWWDKQSKQFQASTKRPGSVKTR